MNWGGFAGGLSQGFMNGIVMGKTLKDVGRENKIEKIREQGIAEAAQARQADINSLIGEVGVNAQTGPQTGSQGNQSGAQAFPVSLDGKSPSQERAVAAPISRINPDGTTDRLIPQAENPAAPNIAAQGIAPVQAAPSGGFKVGDKTFATRDEAIKHAESQVGDSEQYNLKILAPRMRDAYIEMGDIEKANAWSQYAESTKGRRAMSEWASANRYARIGNIERAADHIFNLYKEYDDGITPVSKSTVKDDQGNIRGFNVVLKDAKGQEFTQFIDPKALTEMGLTALAPPQMFEYQFKRQMEADKQTGAMMADDRKFGRELQRDAIKHERDLEKISIQEQLKQAGASSAVMQRANDAIAILKRSGRSQEYIDSVMPEILGLGTTRKGPGEAEIRALVYRALSSDQYAWRRLTPEQRKAAVEEDVRLFSSM